LKGLKSGCQVTAPRGGNGLFFTIVTIDSVGDEALVVSHDSGDTWRTVNTASAGTAGAGAYAVLDLTRRAVYRAGFLDSFGRVPPGDAPPYTRGDSLSASADDGASWTYVERQFNPSLLGYGALSIAPDYRASDAWFRLLAAASSSAQPDGVKSPVLLQHSSDGGQTWTVIGPPRLTGALSDPATALRANLMTTPRFPARVCFTLREESLKTATGPTSTPYLGESYQPDYDILAASDNAGASWSGSVIERAPANALWTSDAPPVSVGANGACYAADWESSGSGGVIRTAITYYRLAPGANATPTAVATLANALLENGVVFEASSGDERLLAFVSTEIHIACGPPCPKGGQPGASATYLLWIPAPA
jgi:hypothetical protein